MTEINFEKISCFCPDINDNKSCVEQNNMFLILNHYILGDKFL